nr:Smad nuclear interacting protein 1 [Hymenolepis microstoma]
MHSKHSPKIKREPITPPDANKRYRLRSPMIIDHENEVKPKRSRLSSPVLINDNRDYDRDRRKIKPDPDFVDRSHTDRRSHSPRRSRRRENHNVHERRSLGKLRDNAEESKPTSKAGPKAQVNFELSGKLAADTNSYKGVVIKYNEPEDARKPTQFWRLYPFKGNEALKVMHIHRQSGYLIGSDTRVVEIPMLHPSISKQHAALQFRFTKGKERLYVIDLESTNGTYLNGNKIETRRYYELRERDVLKFGYSSREYVVMTDTAYSDEEDDVK